MKSTYAAVFLAFSLSLMIPATALAASGTGSGRYFLSSTSLLWRNVMGARHVFGDGFTADLSDLQVSIAKLAGLNPIEVKKFNILADEAASQSISPTPQLTPTQPVPWGVRTVLGDETLKTTQGGAGISIALLDTGVDGAHPDLKGRITACADLTDPAKGYIDGQCDDQNGHGTHMAGILVADGGPDGAGIYGMAPQASVSAYRVCDAAGTCLADDIAVALRAATDAGANIVVLGMGGEAESSLIDDAVAYATDHGVLIIAAAGNDGPYDDSLNWPARDTRIVSVGAVDNELKPAEFSSRGLNASTKPYTVEAGDVELGAPGVNIESTFRDGGYAILSGTSMAAPHVAGLAALVWQKDVQDPADATRTLLHTMAHDIEPAGDDAATGWGMPVLPH